MTLPFRNTNKVPRIYPANSVVGIFDNVEDVEAAINEFDKNGFGEDLVYVRGESALNLNKQGEESGFARAHLPRYAGCDDGRIRPSSKGMRKR